MRFLFYSHDGLGLGHIRRHLAVAAALTELSPDSPVLLATGVDEVDRLGLPPNVGVLRLPGVRKVGKGSYLSRRMRIPSADILALRSAVMKASVESFKPDVLLVDKHPLGVRGELKGALVALRELGGKAILGFRDILDDAETVLKEWEPYDLQTQIAHLYDEVLVYGQRAVFDPITEYRLPAELEKRVHFCGYVVNRPLAQRVDPQLRQLFSEESSRPRVLVTTGGGEDGFAILETFVRACKGAPWQGIAIAGPLAATTEFEVLEPLAAETGVVFLQFVPGLDWLLHRVDALVSMGGYNTLAEALSTGVPTVCIPRCSPRVEQLLRARAFERLGLLRVVTPDKLSAEALREQLFSALGTPRGQVLARSSSTLDFNGAFQSARQLLAAASSRRAGVTQPQERIG